MYKFDVFFKVRESKQNGAKFKSFFTTSTKDGKSMTVKFTKEVKELPETAVLLTVRPENARISTKGGFTTLVISGYEKSEPVADMNVAKYFDEVSDEVEEVQGIPDGEQNNA